MVYPHLDLRLVSLLTGIFLIITHGVALLRPAMVQEQLRKFPRSGVAGALLLAVDAIWALALLVTMDLGEFSSMRTLLIGIVLAATFLTYRYVDELLAVRAFGMFLLLVSEPLIEAAFLRPEAGRLLLVLLAYGWVVAGMLLVGLPYLLRDAIDWARAEKARWGGATVAGVVYGGLLLLVGITGI